ncbi:MAG: 23S rRNA (pseudouridine(1915)-N(3))-methyltransferase RlmH [Desulfitobacteriaceae bacterium]
MLQVKIITVGKIREKYLQEGINEYKKRLSGYVNLQILEVADEPCPDKLFPAEEERVKMKEGERVLKLLSPQDYTFLLDIQGKEMDSPKVSHLFDELTLGGRSSLAFIIGGSLGVAENVRQRADFQWSFSKLTFPHPMMRLILLEQIYRALKISAGEPYHK